MKNKHALLLVVLAVLMSSLACATVARPAATTEPPSAPPIELATTQPVILQAQPSPTSTVLPSPAPTQTPPATATQTFAGLSARVTVQTIRFRQGPGTVFPTLGTLPQGTQVNVLGKARGDEWVLAETGGQRGWLAVVFLDLDGSPSLGAVPVQEPLDGYVVQGKVTAQDGAPISGVVFAVVQGSGSSAPRTDAETGPDGQFFAYLPTTARGQWQVEIVGVNCASPVMDANCKYPGKFNPMWQTVTLPVASPLIFTYTP